MVRAAIAAATGKIEDRTLPWQIRLAWPERALEEACAERRGFGYRRLGRLLERECHVMNRKKLYRLTARKS